MWMNVSTLPANMREHVITTKDHISVIARTDGRDKTVKRVRKLNKFFLSKYLYSVKMFTMNHLFWLNKLTLLIFLYSFRRQ